MSFDFRTEIRSEVGYDAAKDFTFLQTNVPELSAQLFFPVSRDSREDHQIRTFLENKGIIDFTELSKTVTLPSPSHKTFGIVGNEADDTLTPENYRHLVLFGKEGSGAHNLIRFWLLWAVQKNMRIISVENPALYGVEPYLPPHLVHHLNPAKALREQVEALGVLNEPNPKVLFLVGADYQPTLSNEDEDNEFMGHIQNGLGVFKDFQSFYSFIRLRPLHQDVTDNDFFGSLGEPENVSYALIGDVTERTARFVGADVTMRNNQGVAWFRQNSTGQTKRVRTFLVPASAFKS